MSKKMFCPACKCKRETELGRRAGGCATMGAWIPLLIPAHFCVVCKKFVCDHKDADGVRDAAEGVFRHLVEEPFREPVGNVRECCDE